MSSDFILNEKDSRLELEYIISHELDGELKS